VWAFILHVHVWALWMWRKALRSRSWSRERASQTVGGKCLNSIIAAGGPDRLHVGMQRSQKVTCPGVWYCAYAKNESFMHPKTGTVHAVEPLRPLGGKAKFCRRMPPSHASLVRPQE